MAIARLHKVTIAGASSEKHRVVSELQAFGRCHVIDSGKAGQRGWLVKDQRALEALKFLSNSKYKRRALSKSKNFYFTAVVDESLAIKQSLRDTQDQLDAVNERITRITPWGDFTFPPESYVDHFRFWFYLLPVSRRNALQNVALPWQIVGRSSTQLYVVIISDDEPPVDILPVAREHLGSKSLQQLLDEQEQLETQRDELFAQREALTRFLYLIRQHMVQANNTAHFKFVLEQLSHQGDFFTLQAWLPSSELSALEHLSKQAGFAFVAEKPQVEDNPPTLLNPKKGFDSGADLAAIYQTPGYRGWDPSAHLYLSFAVFFAMILSDAGYGVLLGLGLVLFWGHLGHSHTGRALRVLMRFMVLVCIIWGALVGSYFGYSPPEHSWLHTLHIIQLSNYDLMMKLSVGVGVVHIVLGNLTAAWNRRVFIKVVLAKLGWVIMSASGYCLWLFSEASAELAVVRDLSLVGIIGGVLLVVGSGGNKPVVGFKSLLLNIVAGLLAITNVTKLFGDVLSYMRLFALGLASASLAITFNQLAAPGLESGGLGYLTGALIFIVGHAVNLALGLMGGVVHGLRLNFIEFYNWGEPGEGYVFSPFRLMEATYE